MARVVEIKGVQNVIAKLRAKRLAARGLYDHTAVVGYTQKYAIYVHEDLTAAHAAGKTAKYLEKPARELKNSGEFARIIRTEIGRGRTMGEALLIAGLRLQRESQLVVPIDTSALKNSAFTKLEPVT